MKQLRDIVRGKPIENSAYQEFLEELLTRPNKHSSIIAVLAALSAKPIQLADVVNWVDYLESLAPKKVLDIPGNLINIVGTGGGIATFNVSTTACFVAAAAGAKVLKSGSYSYNSQCGSLDLLNALGLNLNMTENGLKSMLTELNLGFVSPSMYPPILRRIAVSIHPLSLKEIGGFINKIGPLICPYQVHGQICGVSSYDMIDVFSQALKQREMLNSMVVWAEIGMDEFSAIGSSHYTTIDENIDHKLFVPSDHNIYHIDQRELVGSTPEENKSLMLSVLKHGKPSAAKDTVIINAAFTLKLSKIADTLNEAIAMARESIDNLSAFYLVQNAAEFSQEIALEESVS